MIICKNICKEYVSGVRFQALNEVTFHVEKGEFCALIGHSGSGKSTMLNMVGLIDTPTRGEIYLDGISVSGMSVMQMAKVRNEKIGYVFQSFFLENSYSVTKNVEMPLLIAGKTKEQRHERVLECLDYVGMLPKKDASISALSGGEKQRVCIARAIANNPQIILADEPCGNLDTDNSEKVMSLLESLNKKGTTILLVTHDLEDVKHASHVVKLRDGKVILDEK